MNPNRHIRCPPASRGIAPPTYTRMAGRDCLWSAKQISCLLREKPAFLRGSISTPLQAQCNPAQVCCDRHDLLEPRFWITSGLPTNSSFPNRLPLPACIHLSRAAAEGTEFQLSTGARHLHRVSIAVSEPGDSCR